MILVSSHKEECSKADHAIEEAVDNKFAILDATELLVYITKADEKKEVCLKFWKL